MMKVIKILKVFFPLRTLRSSSNFKINNNLKLFDQSKNSKVKQKIAKNKTTVGGEA